jgi:hypothetical protein
MEREIHKNITPNKVTKKSSGDDDAESIIDYYMKVGIIKVPGEFKMGGSITTDWYNNLEDKERERIWNDAGDAWWKAYGINTFEELYTEEMADNFVEGDIQEFYMKKVYDKIQDDKIGVEKILKQRYGKVKKKSGSKKKLPKNKMKMPRGGILNNRYKLNTGGVGLKNKITEKLLETKLQSTAPFSVEADDVWGGYIRIQYDNQSGTTTEGVEALIKVLQIELMGWEYVMKHEEFYWEDGAWENKYDKE